MHFLLNFLALFVIYIWMNTRPAIGDKAIKTYI